MSFDGAGDVSCVIPLPSGFIVSMVEVSVLQQCVQKAILEPFGAQSASTASSAVACRRPRRLAPVTPSQDPKGNQQRHADDEQRHPDPDR